jgi:glycine cleavage system T protein (aminomethyltransferase)
MTDQPQTPQPQNSPLRFLPLHELHVSLGGKMVPFAGYEMPVQYPMGVMKEHTHVREKAGLFDVSHMGQAWLSLKEGVGEDGAHEKVAAAIETLVPGEIQKLKPGRIRYSVLLNDQGGVEDDLMITNPLGDENRGRLFLVVNAAVKEQDFALLRARLGEVAELVVWETRALLALQGPKAADIMAGLVPEVAKMPFMSMLEADIFDSKAMISRCGYTGEDGFEISVPASKVEALAQYLLDHEDVAPIGLGARDSLRLEAGLCLYGHDMSSETTPVEANITFAIGKRRREEGGFAGAAKILGQLRDGAPKLRVGIKPEGRAPAREGTQIQSPDGKTIGVITSGGFGPTFGGPVAMGYVDEPHTESGTDVQLIIRGKPAPAKICDMPFVVQNYYRAKK